MRMSQITKVFEGAHCERRRGTAQEADNYCNSPIGVQADGSQVMYKLVFGEISNPNQGHRSDLDDIKQKIQAGVDMKVIADEHFSSWVRYNKSFDKYEMYCSKERDFKTEVVILTGASGTGKTRTAREQMPTAWWFPPGFKGDWFDGYRGHDDVVLDEPLATIPYRLMLRIMDRYPCLVPVKGGFVNWRPKRMLICIKSSPLSLFPGEADMSEFFRRITAVVETEMDGQALSLEGVANLKGKMYTDVYMSYKLNF